MQYREVAQRRWQVLFADQTTDDWLQNRSPCCQRGFHIILKDSENQPLGEDRLDRLPEKCGVHHVLMLNNRPATQASSPTNWPITTGYTVPGLI